MARRKKTVHKPEVFAGPCYRIETACNGYFYLVTRLADGASALFQGDDALAFERMLESTSDRCTDDDVCDEYDCLFAAKRE